MAAASNDVEVAIRPRLPPKVMAILKRTLPRTTYDRYVGRHEKGSMALWRKLVARAPDASSVLDVGAYHGVYAIAARQERSDLDVYAFEPNAAELDVLRAACRDQGIVVVPMAVSESTGSVTFLVSGETSRIVDSSSVDEVASVDSISLDDWVGDSHRPVALMKVDVEGQEAAVFSGGAQLMERSRPIVLCEVLRDEAGRRVEEVLPSGYVYFHIDEDRGLRQVDRIRRQAWKYKNHLLVPEESLDHLRA